MLEKSQIISVSSEIMGGTPVFTGTRVPIQTFLDYLKAGESIDDFLAGFPTVTREQAISLRSAAPAGRASQARGAFLEEAEKQVITAIK